MACNIETEYWVVHNELDAMKPVSLLQSSTTLFCAWEVLDSYLNNKVQMTDVETQLKSLDIGEI